MSKQNAFGEAAAGQVAKNATVEAVSIMGRDMGIKAVAQIVLDLGQAIDDKVARPVNWLTANTIATPSGGLEAKGHENAEYDYQGGGMYGFEDKEETPKAPTATLRA